MTEIFLLEEAPWCDTPPEFMYSFIFSHEWAENFLRFADDKSILVDIPDPTVIELFPFFEIEQTYVWGHLEPLVLRKIVNLLPPPPEPPAPCRFVDLEFEEAETSFELSSSFTELFLKTQTIELPPLEKDPIDCDEFIQYELKRPDGSDPPSFFTISVNSGLL